MDSILERSILKDTKSHNTYTDLGCAFNFSFQYGSLKTESKTESTQSQ